MAKNVLGRGLEALISSKPIIESEQIKTRENEGGNLIKLNSIVTSANQPRLDFNKEKLAELMMSIKEKGVVEPILVRPKDDKYEIIAGERRWRAAKEIGFEDMPVIIKNVSDKEAFEMSLIENIQREDLNPLEEAKAYQFLMEQYKTSHEEIARAVGKDRSTISNSMRLLRLPEDIQKEIRNENLTMGHARALLSLESPVRQKLLAKKIVRKGLSVREAELLVKKETGTLIKQTTKEKQRDPYLLKIAEEMQHLFGTKVSVAGKSNKGKIEITYYSADDISRILDILDIKL
jgi:ParB family chromosome partitioning protein